MLLQSKKQTPGIAKVIMTIVSYVESVSIFSEVITNFVKLR